jgi:AcrR family transcriptional regulator
MLLAEKPTPTTGIDDRILDAVESLLARYGYAKMTMEDIAREAGLGRRTIYLHFPSKEEVALRSIDRIVDRLVAELRRIAAEPLPAGARVREMIRTRVLFRFDSVRDYHQNFNDMFASLRGAYLQRREGYFQAEACALAEVIAEGQRDGALRPGDAAALSRTLITATNALLPFSLSPRELGSREQVDAAVTAIAELLLSGLEQPAPPSLHEKRAGMRR